MDISFDVRGGLVIRQMHHWAALLFMASIVGLILRVFFTGAYRKPRRASWIVALLLFWTGCLAGLTGYTLPDDALSGTSLRIASDSGRPPAGGDDAAGDAFAELARRLISQLDIVAP